MSETKEPRDVDGGPAFNCLSEDDPLRRGPDEEEPGALQPAAGLSKREWFAGLALQGLIAHGLIPHAGEWDRIAELAYEAADAMINARK